MNEPTLFDAPAAEGAAKAAAGRADGIARADENAHDEWKQTALDGLRLLCRRPQFTVCDLRRWLDQCEVTTHNNSALGPVMLQGKREGWCRNTKVMTAPTYGSHHHDVPIWEGLL